MQIVSSTRRKRVASLRHNATASQRHRANASQQSICILMKQLGRIGCVVKQLQFAATAGMIATVTKHAGSLPDAVHRAAPGNAK